MGKEKRKAPTLLEEIARRKEIKKKADDIGRRIEAIKIPEVRRAN